MPVPFGDRQGSTAPQSADAEPPSYRLHGSTLTDTKIDELCGAELKDRLNDVRTELALAQQQHETNEKATVDLVNQLLAELHRHEEQSSMVKNECKGLVADIEQAGKLRKAMQDRVSTLMRDCGSLRSDIVEAQRQNGSASSKDRERDEKRLREQAAQRVQVAKSKEQRSQDDLERKRRELEELLRCQKELLEEANGCEAMCETYDASASNLLESAQAAIHDADEAAKSIRDVHREDLLQFHEQYASLISQIKEVQLEAQRWLKEQQASETKCKSVEAKVKNSDKRRTELRAKVEKLTKEFQEHSKELEAAQLELKRREAEAIDAEKKLGDKLFKLQCIWAVALITVTVAMSVVPL